MTTTRDRSKGILRTSAMNTPHYCGIIQMPRQDQSHYSDSWPLLVGKTDCYVIGTCAARRGRKCDGCSLLGISANRITGVHSLGAISIETGKC